MRETGKLARFKSPKPDPHRVIGLADSHPAMVEARTMFRRSVVAPADSPRLLVGGQNNSKLGGRVTKGDRAGWPIFQLTLEERATCPRSCEQFSVCYGNSSPFSRRHGTDGLLPILARELEALQAKHPKGFMVRLHALGDFFSVEYVAFWAQALTKFPALHVWGYTARDAYDPIGEAVLELARDNWDRFAIRLSGCETIVVLEDPKAPPVVMCPAQVEKTMACGSCGLCWSPSARDKVIGFLKHGMTRGPRVVAD